MTTKPSASSGHDEVTGLLDSARIVLDEQPGGVQIRIDVSSGGSIERIVIPTGRQSISDMEDDSWYGFEFHGLAYNLNLFNGKSADSRTANVYTTIADGDGLSSETDTGIAYTVSICALD